MKKFVNRLNQLNKTIKKTHTEFGQKSEYSTKSIPKIIEMHSRSTYLKNQATNLRKQFEIETFPCSFHDKCALCEQ